MRKLLAVGATVDAQFVEPLAAVGPHRFHQFPRLAGNALQRGPDDLGPVRRARHAGNRAAIQRAGTVPRA
jgi:hypothetical protein